MSIKNPVQFSTSNITINADNSCEYTVQKGNWFSHVAMAIAKAGELDWKDVQCELVRINPQITDINNIKPGDKINLGPHSQYVSQFASTASSDNTRLKNITGDSVDNGGVAIKVAARRFVAPDETEIRPKAGQAEARDAREDETITSSERFDSEGYGYQTVRLDAKASEIQALLGAAAARKDPIPLQMLARAQELIDGVEVRGQFAQLTNDDALALLKGEKTPEELLVAKLGKEKAREVVLASFMRDVEEFDRYTAGRQAYIGERLEKAGQELSRFHLATGRLSEDERSALRQAQIDGNVEAVQQVYKRLLPKLSHDALDLLAAKVKHEHALAQINPQDTEAFEDMTLPDGEDFFGPELIFAQNIDRVMHEKEAMIAAYRDNPDEYFRQALASKMPGMA